MLAESLTLLRIKPGDVEAVERFAGELGLTVYDAAYVYYARLHGAGWGRPGTWRWRQGWLRRSPRATSASLHPLYLAK